MKINLADLEGRWYINQSNFPMWTKGDKHAPTFNYQVDTKNGTPVLLDRVEYVKKGKVKHIDGVDKAVNESNTGFVWRGNGLLAILKSKWKILYFDRERHWAVICFEKTLFTPSGYDVISRERTLNGELAQHVKHKLAKLGITADLMAIHHPE